MARIVIEGLSLAQRDQLFLHVRATQALLEDVRVALIAGRQEPKPEKPAPVHVSRPVTHIGKLPTVKWQKVASAIENGELDEYVCLQKTSSAFANKSQVQRRYPFLEIQVNNNHDGTAMMRVTLARKFEERGV